MQEESCRDCAEMDGRGQSRGEMAPRIAHQHVLIDPGKPRQNGADESFNGKFRDECLSLEWFRNRTEAKIMIENWRKHYNEVRPHSSLSYQTPVEFTSKSSSTNPIGASL
jgi:putative transposase